MTIRTSKLASLTGRR